MKTLFILIAVYLIGMSGLTIIGASSEQILVTMMALGAILGVML